MKKYILKKISFILSIFCIISVIGVCNTTEDINTFSTTEVQAYTVKGGYYYRDVYYASATYVGTVYYIGDSSGNSITNATLISYDYYNGWKYVKTYTTTHYTVLRYRVSCLYHT